MLKAAADNDIVIKGVIYDLFDDLLKAVPLQDAEACVLGALKFIALKKFAREFSEQQATILGERLSASLAILVTVEPTQAEIKLAAELEFTAQQQSLNLDPGESLLCAIVLERSLFWLLTGDKRAIVSIAKLSSTLQQLHPLHGKILCLEQLMKRAITNERYDRYRKSICEKMQTDRTLEICFQCSTENVTSNSCIDALESYIQDLRGRSGALLGS